MSNSQSSKIKKAYSEALQRVERHERFTSIPDAFHGDDVLQGRKCPYCGNAPEFVDSSVIYGRSYGMIWLCTPCRAYVGIHKDSINKPLGRLANTELRYWKIEAHAALDPLHKNGIMERNEVYRWLSQKLAMRIEHTHIGMMNVYQCKAVIELCIRKYGGKS